MLKIIFGPAGCGKSSRILNEITANAEKGVSGQLLLVPEQFSHETERRLAAAGGASICRSAEVLSFSRLATRVFSAEGGLCRETLDAGGRVLSMALALDAIRSRLRLYGAASTRPAFYTELLQAVDEFKSYAVTVPQLHNAADAAGLASDGALAVKLEDLSLIMESYDAVCANGKADPADTLARLADKIASGTWAAGRTVFVDGFSGFTGLELKVLEALLLKCDHMTLALTCDSDQEGLFVYNAVRRTLSDIRNSAAHVGIQTEVEYMPPSSQIRPAIRFMNEHLFQSDRTPCPTSSQEIALLQAGSLREECQAAVLRILQLVHAGARYSDIAVAVTDRNSYAPVLQGLCEQYEIPIYLAGSRDILQKPVITCLMAALSAATSGMEAVDVLRYLKTGLSPVSQDTCDMLENYALVWNLRGSRWATHFEAHPEGFGKELDIQAEKILEKLNQGREDGIVPLLHLQEALCNADHTDEMVLALYAFIEEIHLETRLENQARQLQEAGRAQEAAEWVQLYAIITAALEQCYAVLAGTKLQPADFCRLLELQISQYDVGTIPVTLDAVLCGSISSLRNRTPVHLLVLGAADGLFPSGKSTSGVLTEADRQQLEGYGIVLSADQEGYLNQEMADILDLLSSPRQTLHVSCQAESTPSFLFERLCTLFPESKTDSEGWKLELCRENTAAALFLRKQQEPGWDTPEELCRDLPAVTAQVTRLRSRAAHQAGNLSAEMVDALWQSPVYLSASRLETCAACQQKFFLRYGLKAEVYQKAEFSAPEFGTFVHYVLENTVRQTEQEGGFSAVSESRINEIAEDSIRQYTEEEMYSLKDQNPRFIWLYNRNLEEVYRVVQNLTAELQASDFKAAEFELQFGQDADEPPYIITTENGSGKISGFVDRVDTWENNGVQYFRIIDYKTGKTSFDFTSVYYGQGMQMLIYLFALERSHGNAGLVQPAGVLYMPARNAILSSPVKLSPEDADLKRTEELRRSGILLDDESVLKAMEHCEDRKNTVFLPCKITAKDGYQKDYLMNREQLKLLRNHVDRRLQELLDQILTGQVSPNPYVKNGQSPCTWCEYASVCHPDDSSRRYFRSRKCEIFWEDLEKEEGRHG